MNIDKLLHRYGRTVFLTGADGWKSEKFYAFIQPLRYKTKLYLSGEFTPIGVNRNSVYLYIGPARHDLTKLDGSYKILDGEQNAYSVDRAEKIFVGDSTVYIWAVIRHTSEGDI